MRARARRTAVRLVGAALAVAPTLVCASAQAACPIELAVYGDRDGVAEIDFSSARDRAAVTNGFRMMFGDGVRLDGIVMWNEGEPSRPIGALMYQCPEGDVTGDELAACTVWSGVIYAADEHGGIDLLPAEGKDAPKTLILSGLGPALHDSTAHGPAGFSRAPWDVFTLKGCQE